MIQGGRRSWVSARPATDAVASQLSRRAVAGHHLPRSSVSKPVSFALSPEDRVQRLRPATYLFRAASAYARSHVTGAGAEAEVEALYGDRDKATSYLVRAASNPATLVEPGWAGAIAQVSVSDLVAALTTLSAGAELIARGTRVDMTGVAHLTVPGRVVNAAAAGAWVREGSAIPVRSQSITSGAVLEPRKLAVIGRQGSRRRAGRGGRRTRRGHRRAPVAGRDPVVHGRSCRRRASPSARWSRSRRRAS